MWIYFTIFWIYVKYNFQISFSFKIHSFSEILYNGIYTYWYLIHSKVAQYVLIIDLFLFNDLKVLYLQSSKVNTKLL